MTSEPKTQTEYDVFLCYAAKDRPRIEGITVALTEAGFRVFDHANFKSALWGSGLAQSISDAISSSHGIMVFVSAACAASHWCTTELGLIQARIDEEPDAVCVLPVRLDDTVLPEFLKDTVYLGADELSATNVAESVRRRLNEFDQKASDAMGRLDDEELVSLIAQKRDETALRIMMEREQTRMLALASRYAGSIDAEDIVMDAWMHIWAHADRFDATRGHLRPWMYAVVRNVALDHMRRRQHPVHLEHRVERAERLEEVQEELLRLMEGLSPGERHLLDMVYVRGMSRRDAAEALGISQATVASRIHRSMHQLRTDLEKREAGASD